MGEVSAVIEVHSHEGVAGLHEGEVNSHISVGSAVGLDVGGFCSVELANSVDGELFEFVGDFASSVVSFARIAFGVFVGKDRHHGLSDGKRGDVLAGNEF